MAGLYVLSGKPEISAPLIGWSDAIRKAIGDPRPSIEQADVDRDSASLQATLGDAAHQAAYASGQ